MPDIAKLFAIHYPVGTKIAVTRKGYRVGEVLHQFKTEKGTVVYDAERYVTYRVNGVMGSFNESFLKADLITGDVEVKVLR